MSRSLSGRVVAGLGLSIATALLAPAPLLAQAAAVAPAASSPAVAPENDFGDDIQGNVPGASAIEGRLMAPCCWTQTIDIHDSEIALSMRHEIRRRLRNGESADAIQASFVERYGPKIMAVQENSQLKNVFIGLSVAMGGAGVAAALMLGRWRKQSTPAPKPKSDSNGKADDAGKDQQDPPRDQWDDKLDEELKELDRDEH